MTGYNVYQVLDSADTLVATTEPGDTTATVSVPANYVEYCYAVSASFQTDSYGNINSKKSNTKTSNTKTSNTKTSNTHYEMNFTYTNLENE